jgi:DNA-directed RNA polymerase subunit RPC12/RpoP
MHIKLECPRCKQPLSVSKDRAGGYVQCPRCNGRLWVPGNRETAAEGVAHDAAALADTVVMAPLPGAPPLSPGGSGAMPAVTPPAAPAAGAADVSARPTAAPRPTGVGSGSVTRFRLPAAPLPPVGNLPASIPQGPPAAAKKTARFITADAAQSAIKLAADGKLPELHLQEAGQSDTSESQHSAVNPLLLLVALCVSVAMSLVLVLVDFSPDEQPAQARKANARVDIADKYFSDLDPKKPLERYQILLREAQEAYSRHDRAGEVDRYRRVLDMLRRERGPFDKGLTGSPSRDKELEEQLTILLGG